MNKLHDAKETFALILPLTLTLICFYCPCSINQLHHHSGNIWAWVDLKQLVTFVRMGHILQFCTCDGPKYK